MAGAHNRLNALAAIAAAHHVGVDPSVALEALSRFGGVSRRLQLRGTVGGVSVIDDFAHHPTAIRATLEAVRDRAGTARIVALLEPRSNTMKQGAVKAALAGSMQGADRIFCYAAPGLGWSVAGKLFAPGARASTHEDLDDVVAQVLAYVRSGDHVVVMSNGGFGGVHARLLAGLENQVVP